MMPREIIQAVRDLYHGMPPQEDISEILLAHGCEYLLSKHGTSSYKKQQLLARVVNNAAVKERYKACIPLFSQTEIPYAIIKGAVLSQAMYGDPLLRSSGDIDILIRRQDADAVKNLLLSSGFVQGRVTEDGILPFSRREILFQTAMSHQTAPYVKETGNRLCPYINVDINMDILWGESDERADMSLVLSHTVRSELFGIPFQKLDPEMEFISLCLHHYKDMNSIYLLSSGSLRLGLYCDIYDYLKRVAPNVTRLLALCQALNIGRYLYTCLYQVQELFEDPALDCYLNALQDSKDKVLLHTFGLNDQERKPWGLSLPERLFHPELAEYLQGLLTEEEKEKIQINRTMM